MRQYSPKNRKIKPKSKKRREVTMRFLDLAQCPRLFFYSNEPEVNNDPALSKNTNGYVPKNTNGYILSRDDSFLEYLRVIGASKYIKYAFEVTLHPASRILHLTSFEDFEKLNSVLTLSDVQKNWKILKNLADGFLIEPFFSAKYLVPFNQSWATMQCHVWRRPLTLEPLPIAAVPFFDNYPGRQPNIQYIYESSKYGDLQGVTTTINYSFTTKNYSFGDHSVVGTDIRRIIR